MDNKQKVAPLLFGAAIGLAARFFPSDVGEGFGRTTTRGDVLFILDGHIADWSGWQDLAEADTKRFAKLLRRRPNQLANAEAAGEVLDRLLDEASIAGCEPDEDFVREESKDDAKILVDPGMPLTAFIDKHLADLDAWYAESRRELSVAQPGTHYATLRMPGLDGAAETFVDFEFELQSHHEEPTRNLPRIEDAPPLLDHWVSFADLEAIATTIDRAMEKEGQPAYRQACVRRFADQIQTSGNKQVTGLDITAGTLNELLAYTGFGKSVVLVESFACWAAKNNVSVAFVLPTNGDVVQMTHRIERALKIVIPGRPVKSPVPLVSPRAMLKVADTALQTSSSGPTADWVWERFGYGCGLAAIATTESGIDGWRPGYEPCAKLRRPRPARKRPETVACPWRTTCGRYRQVRAACSADIIVTSHANLLLGILQAPVDDGCGPNDRVTVEELIMRRCQVVVIDEIDRFQRTVIDQSGRGLLLDYGGRINTPLREFDSDFGTAFGRLHGDIDATVRDAYFGLRYLSETYVSHISYQRIGAISPSKKARPRGPRRNWIVPRRWDNWLTAKIFDIEREEVTWRHMAMFRSLFFGERAPLPGEPESFDEARDRLAAVVTGGSGGLAIRAAREALEELAASVPSNERPKVINRILRRAILERARVYLHRLMASNAQLVDIGVESAQKIADAIGIYGRWRVTPTGPLGRLVFAFTEYHDDTGGDFARLTTAAFGGDPHTYVVTLGDTTALAHAETRRIVLGLSATAYFPWAPHHHVHVKPKWWVTDRNPEAVRIVAAPIIDELENLARISGLDGAMRVSATKRIASRLWNTYLEAELSRLRREDSDRARVLLATTSYAGARHVAEGLADAGVESHRICLAVPPDDDETRQIIDAGRWREIQADRLELFPDDDKADILIAPLARVQRGVNIIGKDDKSALGSVWLIVRPVPLIDEPNELLAHVQAKAHFEYGGPSVDPRDLLTRRRKVAGQYLEKIIHRPPYFHAQPDEVKLGVVAETINGAIQLIGRARRGGTNAALHLVDGAMLDSGRGTDFAALIRRLKTRWQDTSELQDMETYYDTTLTAFFDYATENGAPTC
ncbi:hypothetical protein [Acrocarpospora catenulata]|uniref:hypothetical protein n=1 Tax=Acrocarpospora catenulata TaxID=2836182 RepID=UPI001BD944E1|nr:hypothetical protein [Acrocarpospora catenulata]